MIAIDTNILVYAHREDSEWHARASRLLADLAEGRPAWAIPWPCVHEFLAVVTHPRVWSPPTPLSRAIDQVEAWMESPGLVLLGEVDDHWKTLAGIMTGGKVAGGMVHDARVAAICRSAGVTEIWTADRDYGRFPGLSARNPLVE